VTLLVPFSISLTHGGIPKADRDISLLAHSQRGSVFPMAAYQ
jgi:hypothetical protein